MNLHIPPPFQAKGTPEWTAELPDRLEAAFDSYDFENSEAYRDIRSLAQVVDTDGFSLDFESTVIEGKDWITPGTAFVVLHYDVGSDDPVELVDSFPITIKFSIEGQNIKVVDAEADVSSFYE
ncbi:MAG: hypothetical protein ABL922_14745 [Sphingorhabdus sp.]